MTRWLSITAAAEYLSVAPVTIRRRIKDGRLHIYEAAGLRRLDKEEIDSRFRQESTGKVQKDMRRKVGWTK
jgi:excisionase family DNA binding protein